MKNKILILLLLILSFSSQSQNHEVGVFAGGSNFIGDVGSTTYINPNSPAIGLIYKWNKTKRYSWRFSIIQTTLKGNDADSNLDSRKQRNLSFENSITEASAGLEYDFFVFNLYKFPVFYTPYVYTGVCYFGADNLYVKDKKYYSTGRSNSYAIPIILGIKMKITEQLVLGIESGARYTFANDLDGSTAKDEQYKYLKFGNTNTRDWYMLSGLTLTYTFGKNACLCLE